MGERSVALGMSSPLPDVWGKCLDNRHRERVSEIILSRWVCDSTLGVESLFPGNSLPWEIGGEYLNGYSARPGGSCLIQKFGSCFQPKEWRLPERGGVGIRIGLEIEKDGAGVSASGSQALFV